MTLARNTLYNLAGAIVPMILALVTVPLYLRQIGEARYGILAIVWLLLGYFGSFDLGLSRAAANRIAQLRDAPSTERQEVFWTACFLNAGLGLLAGIAFYFLGVRLFEAWLKMSGPLHVEATVALPWIAAAVPVATVTAAFTGALEGLQRFATVNAIQALGTALFQLVPLITAVLLGPQLQYVIPAAVISRVVTLAPLMAAVKSALPLNAPPKLNRQKMRKLFAYGSWVTITNVVGPILHVFDRFLIGIVLGTTDVAYYVVPFQLVNRAQLVPGALSRALFPHFSAVNTRQARQVARESVIALAAVMTPMIIAGLLFMASFLQIWVGRKFASHATPVGEILLLGIWINGLAFVPFALLQARGRPDIVAKFHLLELIPFLALLWIALHRFGIVGAAAVWVLRVALDAVLLFNAAHIPMRLAKPLIPSATLIAATVVGLSVAPHERVLTKLYFGLPILLLSCSWSLIISARLRTLVSHFLRQLNISQIFLGN